MLQSQRSDFNIIVSTARQPARCLAAIGCGPSLTGDRFFYFYKTDFANVSVVDHNCEYVQRYFKLVFEKKSLLLIA